MNNLHSIAFEDYHPEAMATSYPALPARSHSFKEVSDWNNRYDEVECAKVAPMRKIASNSLEGAGSLAHYLEKHMPDLRRTRVGLSPVQRINMQFGNQWISPRKRKLPKELSTAEKDSNSPMHSTQYSPLSQLYERKKKEREQVEQGLKPDKLNCVPIEHKVARVNLPRTERMSGHMRQMQRRQMMQRSPRIRQSNLPLLIKSP